MAAKHKNDKMSHSVVAVVQLMVMLNAVLPRVAEAATDMANLGCQQQCGNTVVPYPFGIGNSRCFHDEWFEMECADNSSNPRTRPVLKKLKVEVIEFRLPTATGDDRSGWLLINNPKIASSPNCTSDTSTSTSTPLDLTGSTFYFSYKHNRFVGSGCSNQVSMIDSNGKQIPHTPCSSSCGQGETVSCCKTKISRSIQLFNASFSSDDDCEYAMLIARAQWKELNPGKSCSLSTIMYDGTVVAWLEWGLRASTPEAAVLEKQSQNDNTTVGIYHYTYDDGSTIQFAYCAQGFQGSAYVPNGCQDVDECLDSPCTNATCVNTYGSHQCVDIVQTEVAKPNATCVNTYGSHRCVQTEVAKPKESQIAIIIVVCSIVGVLLITAAIWGGFKLVKRREENKFFIQNGGLLLQTEGNSGRTEVFKVDDLRMATNHFSKKNRLGQGGQGTVYKGTLTLPAGTTVVAIKECKKIKPTNKSNNSTAVQSPLETGDEMGAFITEVILLSETIHRNIVRLLGCCLETEAPLLVYEYLVNGDLAHHLRNNHNNAEFTLSWEVRLKIAADISGALSYLHFSARIPIYHRDIKTDNILLDHKYTAKIADFGISKSLSANESRLNVEVQGSPGYMDPEYVDSKQYTDKSDVFSFGVVLAELLTGKRPVFSYTSSRGEEKKVILADHFKSLNTEKIMTTFLDVRVKHQGKPDEVAAVIGLAKRCLEREGRNRPTMKDVAMELEKIRSQHTNVYAEEIDDHDYDQYDQTVETITVSPLPGTPARPLLRQGFQTSHAHTSL